MAPRRCATPAAPAFALDILVRRDVMLLVIFYATIATNAFGRSERSVDIVDSVYR
jgi:hypothetical protein